VVGYVNVPVGVGYNAIVNPLMASPDNNINNVLKGVPDGCYILQWDAIGQSFGQPIQYYAEPAVWADINGISTATLEPGQGFFFNSTAPTNITFVGDVKQGALSGSLVPGYNCIGQLTPQSGDIMSFGFPAADGDYILYFDNATGAYSQPIQYYAEPNVWAGPDGVVPANINVGQAVMLNKQNTTTWNYTFNVN